MKLQKVKKYFNTASSNEALEYEKPDENGRNIEAYKTTYTRANQQCITQPNEDQINEIKKIKQMTALFQRSSQQIIQGTKPQSKPSRYNNSLPRKKFVQNEGQLNGRIDNDYVENQENNDQKLARSLSKSYLGQTISSQRKFLKDQKRNTQSSIFSQKFDDISKQNSQQYFYNNNNKKLVSSNSTQSLKLPSIKKNATSQISSKYDPQSSIVESLCENNQENDDIDNNVEKQDKKQNLQLNDSIANFDDIGDILNIINDPKNEYNTNKDNNEEDENNQNENIINSEEINSDTQLINQHSMNVCPASKKNSIAKPMPSNEILLTLIPEKYLRNPNFNLNKFVEDNPEYVYHLMGVCSCRVCSCGACKCPTQPKIRSVYQFKSTYSDSYIQKSISDINSLSLTQKNNMLKTSGYGNPFLKSSYKQDFDQKSIDYKRVYPPTSKYYGSLSSLSSYKQQYVDWKYYDSKIMPGNKSALVSPDNKISEIYYNTQMRKDFAQQDSIIEQDQQVVRSNLSVLPKNAENIIKESVKQVNDKIFEDQNEKFKELQRMEIEHKRQKLNQQRLSKMKVKPVYDGMYSSNQQRFHDAKKPDLCPSGNVEKDIRKNIQEQLQKAKQKQQQYKIQKQLERQEEQEKKQQLNNSNKNNNVLNQEQKSN